MDNGTRIAFRPSILTAHVTYNYWNQSIFDATNLSAAVPQIPPLEGFLGSFEALFGASYVPGLSTDPESTFSNYVSYLAFLFSSRPSQSDIVDYIGSVLTIPLLVFQPGFFLYSDPIPGFSAPADFVVPIELAQQVVLPSIPPWSVIVYLVVACLVFAWCIGGMITAILVDSPPASNYDVMDFATGVTANHGEGSFSQIFASLTFGNDRAIRKGLEDKAIYVRKVGGLGSVRYDVDGDSDMTRVGFVTDGRDGSMVV
jgi:hypothetical protein